MCVTSCICCDLCWKVADTETELSPVQQVVWEAGSSATVTFVPILSAGACFTGLPPSQNYAKNKTIFIHAGKYRQMMLQKKKKKNPTTKPKSWDWLCERLSSEPCLRLATQGYLMSYTSCTNCPEEFISSFLKVINQIKLFLWLLLKFHFPIFSTPFRHTWFWGGSNLLYFGLNDTRLALFMQ